MAHGPLRDCLKSSANPNMRSDYLVRLEAALPTKGLMFRLAYVPDRLILSPESFSAYITLLDQQGPDGLEALAEIAIEDFNNELVTRWLQVVVDCEHSKPQGISTYNIVMEDRQPGWANDRLIFRWLRGA